MTTGEGVTAAQLNAAVRDNSYSYATTAEDVPTFPARDAREVAIRGFELLGATRAQAEQFYAETMARIEAAQQPPEAGPDRAIRIRDEGETATDGGGASRPREPKG